MLTLAVELCIEPFFRKTKEQKNLTFIYGKDLLFLMVRSLLTHYNKKTLPFFSRYNLIIPVSFIQWYLYANVNKQNGKKRP